jgi:hypothetical protein
LSEVDRAAAKPIRIPADLHLPPLELAEQAYGALETSQQATFLEQIIRSVWKAQETNDLRPLRNVVMGWLAEGRFEAHGTWKDFDRLMRSVEKQNPLSIEEIQQRFGT